MKKVKVWMGFGEGNAVLTRTIKPAGSSGHIILPKKLVGKQAMVIVSDKIEEVEECELSKRN